jgi:16S rRNA (guanine527-N7)-methyltransferase
VFHVKHDEFRRVAALVGISLDADQVARLLAYEDLLRTTAVAMGLIARGTSLRERHVIDSLRAAPLVGRRVADLGSGAGLPGLVVAIARPNARVSLIDARWRPVAFLELAVQRLGLENAVPVPMRVEDVSDLFETATARAFAGPQATWAAAEPLLSPTGTVVYFAGRRFRVGDAEAPGVRVDLVPPPAPLASSGPLVIMTRQ